MNLESIADFVALADCRSFSQAARLRNITQPAFSRRIRALESAVGAELVSRKGGAFRLTAAGKRFLIRARQLLDAAQTAVREARGAASYLAEPVYLIAPAFLSKAFFPGWYRAMQKAIPGLVMRLQRQSFHGAVDDLRKGVADFALVMRARKIEPPYTLDGLESRVVARDRMLAVRAAHAKDTGELLMYERGSYMAACAEHVLGKKAPPEKTVFETSSVGLVKEMAVAGFGLAVLLESMIEDDLVQGYLKPCKGFAPLGCDILLVRAQHLSGRKAEKLWALNAGA